MVRKRALYEKCNVDAEMEKCLDKIFLHDKWDVMTPCDDQVTVLEFIEKAVKGGTLVRLKEGLWFCCNKLDSPDSSDDPDISDNLDVSDRPDWTICFMYKEKEGVRGSIMNLFDYLGQYFERIGCYLIGNDGFISSPEDAPKVLAVLPTNTRRAFQVRTEDKRYIPHILMVSVKIGEDLPESRFKFDDDDDDDDGLIEVWDDLGPMPPTM